VGVENFCTKLPKGTPLRQIWSNKSFGVCGSDIVLTLYGGRKKKYTRFAFGNWMSSITLQPLPRCRDVCIYIHVYAVCTVVGVAINVTALDNSGRDLHSSFLSHIIHHLTYMTGLSDHMVCLSLSL